MNLKWPLILLIAGAVAMAGFAPAPVEERAKRSTVHLGLTDGNCSGTSIGPKLILSATHCFTTGHLLTVNGQPVNVESFRDDGADHRILVLDTDFPPHARMGQTPKQGDEVFMYGNPAGMHDLLRRGYVSGQSDRGYLLDLMVGGGDSGAAVFNERGEVIGMIHGYGAQDAFHVGLMIPFAEGEWPWNP
jgi:hypothetical protein